MTAAPAATVVFFHAHPDDEALLTGGTMAMLAGAGHRVVLVLATDGEAGLAAGSQNLASRRVAEVQRSAEILGCHRVVRLSYPDSGWTESGRGAVPGGSFAALDVAITAAALADVLRAESADVLCSYDRNGGYGHPDHVRVHEVAIAAARLAGTPRLMQATIDRTLLSRAVRLLGFFRLLPDKTATDRTLSWFSDRSEITHRISVRRFAAPKRAALACHQSQTEGGKGPRTATLLLRLPGPIFSRVCGTEWFVEAGSLRTRGTPQEADFFASTQDGLLSANVSQDRMEVK